MSRTRLTVGLVALVGGIIIALVPGFSVWRAGGQMLGQLPTIQGVDTVDQRVGWTALLDDDFVLARRNYIGSDEPTVSEALGDAGFSYVGVLSKDCCGAYDAAWARVESADNGSVVVVLTAADDDWQTVWLVWVLAGMAGAIVGLVLLLRGRGSSAPAMTGKSSSEEPIPLS